MRDSGPVLQSRLGIPTIVDQSWRRQAVWRLLLVLVLLASAPVQAQQPTITSVVNAASYTANGVVPGGIATLFGTGIVSASGIVEAAAVPLPTTLGGTQVLVNNIAAPLFAVANVNRQEQVNFQVPWGIVGANTVTVIAVNGSARSVPRDYTVRVADPGLFTLDGASAIVVHGVTNQLVTAANPAEPGEAVVFYATGLGAVDRAQQSGRPASLTELAKASNAPIVTVGGREAAVQFAGLTPGSIGLYQVNCTFPAGVGGELEVQMTMLGQSSKPARMPVRGGIAGPFGLEFVQIQPGEFTMGCSPGDSEFFDGEKPTHHVRITRGFQIGKYEVTQEQWQAVLGSNPSRFRGATLPVEQVSWDDVQGFLQRLNARNDGYRYRLPTEAEWEYAARAGTTDKYAGAGALGDVAWYDGNSGGTTHPVGQKRPNAWGLYDMLGNVWEWCQDWYGDYSSGAADNPTGPSWGFTRVGRGGSWYGPSWLVRVSYRFGVVPGDRDLSFGFGFRCVREDAAACAGPSITTQPAGRTIASGATADLAVTATGAAPLTYQWYQGARGDTSRPMGTSSATFRTPALRATTTFWVRVTNACGQANSAAATITVDQAGSESRSLEGRIFAAINYQRRQFGLRELAWNEDAANAARAHSRAMADRHFFSHEDPLRGGLPQRLNAAGVVSGVCAENIFMEQGYADPVRLAVQGWMNSPGHRANILDARFTRTGVGIAKAADGTVYVTQIFIS